MNSPSAHISDDTIRDVVTIARELRAEYPNARFFSLGNSPAWIIQAMELCAAKEGKTIETGLIPFSGGYYNCISGDEEVFIRPSKRWKEKIRNRIGLYRPILARIGADTDSIIKAYEQQNKQTIVMDCIYTGGGLASFMYILTMMMTDDPAKRKKLKKALVINAFESKSSTYYDIQSIHMDGQIKYPVKNRSMSFRTMEQLWDLRKSAHRLTAPYNLFYDRSPGKYPVANGKERVVLDLYRRIAKEVGVTLGQEVAWPIDLFAASPRSNPRNLLAPKARSCYR